MRFLHYLFIAVFLMLLYFPAANNKFRWFERQYEGTIPSAPSPELERLDPFPRKYEKYFEERLEIKPWLVKQNSLLKINTLGVSPNPARVIIGKKGWLFLGGKSLDIYLGKTVFTSAELIKIREEMHARARKARSVSGAEFYLVIIPLKHTVYPELLPSFIRRSNSLTQVDQVIRLFQEDTLVKLISLTDVLLKEKRDRTLYYQTDNHWNGYGAYFGYRTIAETLKRKFPAVIPFSENEFVMDSSVMASGGEALMLNVESLYKERRYDFKSAPGGRVAEDTRRNYPIPEGFAYPWDFEVVRVTGNTDLPDGLIIRDSFTDALVPMLAECFNHSVFIFDAWQYGRNDHILEAEKPDVVIDVIVESNLDNLLK